MWEHEHEHKLAGVPACQRIIWQQQQYLAANPQAAQLTCVGLPLPSSEALTGSLSLGMGSSISTSIRTGWHMGDCGSVECTCRERAGVG